MLTTFNEVDMSGLTNLRNEFKDAFIKKHDTKLGFMSPFVPPPPSRSRRTRSSMRSSTATTSSTGITWTSRSPSPHQRAS